MLKKTLLGGIITFECDSLYHCGAEKLLHTPGGGSLKNPTGSIEKVSEYWCLRADWEKANSELLEVNRFVKLFLVFVTCR